MWILKNLAWLVIMVGVAGFAILNVNGRVTEVRLPSATYTNLPLTLVLFSAFALGMFVAFLLTLVQQLRSRAAMGRLTRENQSLKEELKAIRNLPLHEMDLGRHEASGT